MKTLPNVKTSDLQTAANTRPPLRSLAVGATVAGGAVVSARAASASMHELVAKIQSADDQVRGPAWQGAGPAGAAAIPPLAALMTRADFEVARAAKRAIYKIIRYAGRPGADSEARTVVSVLLPLLDSEAAIARREAVWMLSELAEETAVPAMAKLLADPEVREDARCALLRLPAASVTAALKSAFVDAPEEFKYALADSLRQRGVAVAGYPSRKKAPTK